MRISEPFLPFTRDLLCKRIRFDDKLDLIDKIIPVDDKTCLLIDRVRNFHLKAYSPEDEDAVSLQFPLPPYARNNNPNVLILLITLASIILFKGDIYWTKMLRIIFTT